MVKKEKSKFSKFEGNVLNSSEQKTVFGGAVDGKTNGTPITRTGTKPPKTPVSTQTNGDPRPPGPVDGLILPPPFQQQP